MPQAKVGIINVTGYTGSELARLLYQHPGVDLAWVTGRSAVGRRLGEFFPHLAAIDLEIKAEPEEVDLLFSALPHKASAEALLAPLEQGTKVVDLSADLRLKDAEDYRTWYGFTHPAPHLLAEAVYGLVELNRAQIARARLVANPGCYPTAAILALAPALKAGIIEPDIVVDAKSGVSGAGRTLTFTTHFSEANENVFAYALEGHRHLPEIVHELARVAEREISLTFVPHLVPMTRGILCSCYARLVPGKIASGEKGKEEASQLYRDFYQDEPFVKIVDTAPQTKQTWGNNLCLIHPTIDLRCERLVVVSCIDNLVKGAAGQALQCMNLMLGFPETTGLESLAVFP